jgi:hypothetical protein
MRGIARSCMYPLPKENRDEQIFIGLAAGRPGGRAGHYLSHIQLADRRCATYVEYGSTSLAGHPPRSCCQRDRSTQRLLWLFAGQIVASSSGFVVYSWTLGNWVFVVTNMLMLTTARLGQWLFLANRRREETGR